MLSIEPRITATLPFIEKSIQPYLGTAQRREIILISIKEPVLANYTKLQDSFLFVDANKISQVVRNLLSNALKFSKKGKLIL